MTLHPFDIARLVRQDLVLADVLLERIEQGQGSRELLVADLVVNSSLHVAASDAVIVPAIAEHLEPDDQNAAELADGNRRLAQALCGVETAGPETDAAFAEIRALISERSAGGEHDSFAGLRARLGDEAMIELGREFLGAKRHAPSRPRPDSNSAFIRLQSVIDRVKDASSGRAVLAATDGSGLLNAEAQQVVNALAELAPRPIEILDPEHARRQPVVADAVIRLLERGDEDVLPPLLGRVDDITIDTEAGALPARIYDAVPDGDRLKPVVLYAHGGGWVVGDRYAFDASARAIASAVDAVVVSVGYHLAPEHPFPIAHDEILGAARWLRANAAELGGDGDRLAFAGESAGANMVAAACLGLIRSGQPLPLAQVLICPVVSTSQEWPSIRSQADARPLNSAMLGWFFGHLLTGPTAADDRLDLLTAPTAALAMMPPTLVITAQRDPLHDQGVAFAETLKSLGVAAAIREYAGVPHEFFGMSRVLHEGRDAQAASAALLISAFGHP